MRSLPIYFAALVALALMGFGLKFFPFPDPVKPLYAAEIVNQEIAKLNEAAPKFPRKPLLPADVKIVLEGGHGSAVHIGNGIFLTAAHVVNKQTKPFSIKLHDGSVRKAETLWFNTKYDIALVAASGDGLSISDLQCRELDTGESIRIEGNPTIMEFVSATGKIAGAGRKIGFWERVQVVDITILPGQSGGPVYDASGKLVGITVGVATFGMGWSASPTGFGFVVPGKAICPLLARA
jgi:S1-C subfamily serine protease